MVLTPTYYVFKQYSVHQDATYLPVDIDCEEMEMQGANRHFEGKVPMLSATASKDQQGLIHLSLTNVSIDKEQTVTVNLKGIDAQRATGVILTSSRIEDLNTFDQPNKVKEAPFGEVKIKQGVMKVTLPKNSIITLTLHK